MPEGTWWHSSTRRSLSSPTKRVALVEVLATAITVCVIRRSAPPMALWMWHPGWMPHPQRHGRCSGFCSTWLWTFLYCCCFWEMVLSFHSRPWLGLYKLMARFKFLISKFIWKRGITCCCSILFFLWRNCCFHGYSGGHIGFAQTW